jgi:hypothetical protein
MNQEEICLEIGTVEASLVLRREIEVVEELRVSDVSVVTVYFCPGSVL